MDALSHDSDGFCTPITVCTFLQLAYMSVESNNLTGSLPVSWSNMSNLQYVSMAANAFGGNIPDSWGNLSQVSQTTLIMTQVQHGQDSRSSHGHIGRNQMCHLSQEEASWGLSAHNP